MKECESSDIDRSVVSFYKRLKNRTETLSIPAAGVDGLIEALLMFGFLNCGLRLRLNRSIAYAIPRSAMLTSWYPVRAQLDAYRNSLDTLQEIL